MNTKIGKVLKELRLSQGLTQQKLADDLHISRVNYTRYETDAVCPDYDTLLLIADYFDVSLDFIFGRKNY